MPRKKKTRAADPLEPYKRVRKLMPPPEKVLRDERRKVEEREARREIEEDR